MTEKIKRFEELLLSTNRDGIDKLLDSYQKICPDVITNGTKKSFGEAIFGAVFTWIIPIAVGIPVVCKIVDWLGAVFQ